LIVNWYFRLPVGELVAPKVIPAARPKKAAKPVTCGHMMQAASAAHQSSGTPCAANQMRSTLLTALVMWP